MHLDETLAAMEHHDLAFVYFAESRHQKGDWFIAKRRAAAQRVILAHRFTPEEMSPLDFHAAAHHWAYLARERGIRFCYVDFFRVLHATEPLEGLDYIEHIKEALEHAGFEVTANVGLTAPAREREALIYLAKASTPNAKIDLALTGMTTAGVASTSVNTLLDLPERLAIPTVALAAAGTMALPFFEKAHGHLEEQYPPSYTRKLLALTTASLTPIAAGGLVKRDGLIGWGASLITHAASGASLAAITSERDYQLRIEEYRAFNLDWWLPIATVAASIPDRYLYAGALLALIGAWLTANQRQIDLLAKIDPAHAEGHTHHLSAFARLTGDAKIAFGPQPARKWAGLAPFGSALSIVFNSRGRKDLSIGAELIGTLGTTLGLVSFRRPERSLELTTQEAARSFIIGVVAGALLLLLQQND